MPRSYRLHHWFLAKVEEKIEPILAKHGFYRLTGPEYEGGEKGIRGYMYEKEQSKTASIDVAKQYEFGVGGITGSFYLARMFIKQRYLKYLVSPPVSLTPENAIQSTGWVFKEKHEVDTVLDEIAQSLDSYLTTNPELIFKSPWE